MAMGSWAEPVWSSYQIGFSALQQGTRDLFPPNPMCSPDSASARWNLYGLAEQREASLEGRKSLCDWDLCRGTSPHAPACLVASLLSWLRVSTEIVNKHSRLIEVHGHLTRSSLTLEERHTGGPSEQYYMVFDFMWVEMSSRKLPKLHGVWQSDFLVNGNSITFFYLFSFGIISMIPYCKITV